VVTSESRERVTARAGSAMLPAMKRRPAHRRSPWSVAATLGLAHWFLGNVYEAVVDVPALLADARPRRTPGLLGPGSPVRYYAPVAPVTLAATGATLVEDWRAGGDRRAVGTAAAALLSAVGLTGYLVGTTNRRLLRSREPLTEAESRTVVARWHRVNLLRLASLAVAGVALHRASPAARPRHGPTLAPVIRGPWKAGPDGT
jgi:hypothetical protein